MLLTEVIENIRLHTKIDPADLASINKVYKVKEEELQGFECLSRAISETIAKGYDFAAIEAQKAKESPSLLTGPAEYLEITYKTKVINDIAIKYKVQTDSDTDFNENKELWLSILQPSIFKSLFEEGECSKRLKDVDLSELIGKRTKKKDYKSFDSYKYVFYPSEDKQWANPLRLKSIKFTGSHMLMIIDMPVKEVKED